ncbi:MAG: PAS domain S-box protein, partial [Proteobacteria bacterium]|nr:PAS domain S-box protein [Pseudomonadota bacterium]
LKLAKLPMLLLTQTYKISQCSEACLEIFPDLSLGQDLSKVSSLEESNFFYSLLRCLDSDQLSACQARVHSLPGQVDRHLVWTAKKLRSHAGHIEGFLLVAKDQTDKENLEEELKRSFRLVRDQKMALDESAIVAMTNHLGVINYVNDKFCEISGYSREDLLGQTHALVKSGFHPQGFFKDLWQTIRSGRVWKGEIHNRTKSGKSYWVDTTIVPFLDDLGRPYQFIAIRYDITEKKIIQERLENERVRSMYAEKMASLGELAAGIAHELGNPAASINAWLDVLESQHQRESLDMDVFMQTMPRVKRDAKRMRDIIRGMLTYARDGSRDPFQSEGVQNILQQVVDYCGFKLRTTGTKIELNVPNPYLTLDCRITEVSQMLVNFVLNACDAVKDLDVRWIELAARELHGAVEFSITDSGLGIPDELGEKIFQPFFTSKGAGQGTGLGLSIAKSIIDNHQGAVIIDRSTQHTRFVITLPRQQAQRE